MELLQILNSTNNIDVAYSKLHAMIAVCNDFCATLVHYIAELKDQTLYKIYEI